MVRALRSDTDIHPAVKTLHHPAAQLLDHLRQHGAPVVMHLPPWTCAQLDAAMAHGSHLST